MIFSRAPPPPPPSSPTSSRDESLFSLRSTAKGKRKSLYFSRLIKSCRGGGHRQGGGSRKAAREGEALLFPTVRRPCLPLPYLPHYRPDLKGGGEKETAKGGRGGLTREGGRRPLSSEKEQKKRVLRSILPPTILLQRSSNLHLPLYYLRTSAKRWRQRGGGASSSSFSHPPCPPPPPPPCPRLSWLALASPFPPPSVLLPLLTLPSPRADLPACAAGRNSPCYDGKKHDVRCSWHMFLSTISSCWFSSGFIAHVTESPSPLLC